MLKSDLNRHAFPGIAKVAALAALAATLGWNPVDATAAQRFEVPRAVEAQRASARDVDLEEVFWLCDYAASTGMVDPSERAACTVITDQLKLERFGGDFEQMLRWWQANRVVRHQQLERDEDSSAAK
jgi:hypothetical protein